MADCVSQHLRAQGKALVSVANCSSGNMVDADGNPVPGTSSGSGVQGMYDTFNRGYGSLILVILD